LLRGQAPKVFILANITKAHFMQFWGGISTGLMTALVSVIANALVA
jgi:hypothetical protein